MIRKREDDGFEGTSLEAELMTAGVRALAVCGVMSEMCVLATARRALELDYRVVLPHDAHATYDIPAAPDISDVVPHGRWRHGSRNGLWGTRWKSWRAPGTSLSPLRQPPRERLSRPIGGAAIRCGDRPSMAGRKTADDISDGMGRDGHGTPPPFRTGAFGKPFHLLLVKSPAVMRRSAARPLERLSFTRHPPVVV